MAQKMYILFAALVFAGFVTPIAHAQLGILSSLVNITGLVPCSAGGSVTAGTSSVFPNATVQLRCGSNVIGSTTTNSNGVFSIMGSLPTALLSSLFGICNIIVTTPLVSCNVSLPPTGVLVAGLNLINSVLGILNFATGPFSLVQNLA